MKEELTTIFETGGRLLLEDLSKCCKSELETARNEGEEPCKSTVIGIQSHNYTKRLVKPIASALATAIV
jgi:hypothetical protein